MFVRRSFWTFKVCAIFTGASFLVIAGLGIYGGITEGMEPKGWLINIFMAVLGIALLIGGIYVHKVLGNANAGKKDESIQVMYAITYRGQTHTLENINQLKSYMQSLVPGEEIVVRLMPEYFGLAEWKFIKIKNYYLSFVQIHKKDKMISYFIVPHNNMNEAVAPFAEVFVERKAVNTSNLIDMKRYHAVLEYYKLK